MALRKINIAVDCTTDKERDEVQQIMSEISGMRVLRGDMIVGMFPYIKSHQGELMQLFGMIKNGGVKSLLSVQGGVLLNKLRK